jgi:crotonobetainyl-CoA:carnitine CoA-transferase CaiB-like acyl-CoA transferase
VEVATPSGVVSYPPSAARRDGEARRYGAVPALGEHSEKVWAEFLRHTKQR